MPVFDDLDELVRRCAGDAGHELVHAEVGLVTAAATGTQVSTATSAAVVVEVDGAGAAVAGQAVQVVERVSRHPAGLVARRVPEVRGPRALRARGPESRLALPGLWPAGPAAAARWACRPAGPADQLGP